MLVDDIVYLVGGKVPNGRCEMAILEVVGDNKVTGPIQYLGRYAVSTSTAAAIDGLSCRDARDSCDVSAAA
jgi:hypothetical protein